jgi:hypothetical protein
MTTAENKKVIAAFVGDVINQGRLDRADYLVALDFVELDPLPGSSRGERA